MRTMVALFVLMAFHEIGMTSAHGQGYYVGPRVRYRTPRRVVVPARPPYVEHYGPTTRVYTIPANPRQLPSRYDYIEYDARRPHWSFDNNLWMSQNY